MNHHEGGGDNTTMGITWKMPNGHVKRVLGQTVKGKLTKQLYMLFQSWRDVCIQMKMKMTQMESSKMEQSQNPNPSQSTLVHRNLSLPIESLLCNKHTSHHLRCQGSTEPLCIHICTWFETSPLGDFFLLFNGVVL